MAQRFHLLRHRGIAHRQGGQEHFLALKGRIGVITALDVGAKEAREIDPFATGSEAGLAGAEIDRQHGQPGFRHLAGDGAFPDEVVHRQVAAFQPRFSRRAEALAGGADRLMGLLRIAGLGAELPRPLAQILLAVEALHTAAGGADRLIRKMNRIGSHVSDETAFVEALGAAHRLPRREAQLAVRLLLQRAGGERRHRLSHRWLLFHRIHGPGRGLNRCSQRAGLLLRQQPHLAARLETAGAFVEVVTAGDSAAAHMGELGFKTAAGMLELGFEIPVAAAAKGPPGPFPLHQQADSNRLNPPGREPPRHLFPQQGGEGVTDEAIQDPARLLGMNKLHVQITGLIQSFADGFLGDLVKHHPLHRNLGGQQLQQVPADAFPFAIFVRGQQQLIRTLQGIFELPHHLFLVLRHHVQGLEVGFSVDAEVGPFLTLRGCWDLAGVVGEIPHMAHGRLDLEPLRKEAADGAGLRRAFNDDEGVRHRRAMNRAPSLSHRQALCMSSPAEERRYSPLSAMDSGRHARDGCLSSRRPGHGSPW